MKKFLPLQTRILILLFLLGIGSLLVWAFLASFFTISPFAGFFHKCTPMLSIPKYYFGIGVIIFAILGFWAGRMVSVAIYQEKTLQLIVGQMKFSENWPEKLKLAIDSAGLNPSQVRLIESEEALAFTYGFFRPQIAVSEYLIGILEVSELKAVLLHEKYHGIRRDPLKLFIIKVLFSFFTPIKSISKLVSYFVASIEIAADKYAMKHMDHEYFALPAALLKLIQEQTLAPGYVPGFTNALEARIEHCLNREWEPKVPLVKMEQLFFNSYFLLSLGGVFYVSSTLFYWLTCH